MGKYDIVYLRPAELVMELVLVGEDIKMTRWGQSEAWKMLLRAR
jgi:hypothetical protein